MDAVEKKSFVVTGNLEPESWEELYVLLGRLGLDIRPVSIEDKNEAKIETESPFVSTKQEFLEHAPAANTSKTFAGNAWRQLALLDGLHVLSYPDAHLFVPNKTDFENLPVLFEPMDLNIPDRKPTYVLCWYQQIRTGGLRLDGLSQLVDQIDERVSIRRRQGIGRDIASIREILGINFGTGPAMLEYYRSFARSKANHKPS